MDMSTLLSACVQHSASDLHIRVNLKPSLRVAGRIRALEGNVVVAEHSEALMREVLPQRLADELEETGAADFGYSFEGGVRFRINAFKEKSGYGIVCRRIPQEILSFDEIGLPEAVQDLLTRPRGLILVTGPTGSGKTTTLATMVDEVNRSHEKHIVTIEDPIEYYHDHKRSVISQREVGVHTSSFAEAMRRALRQDPDVILLGEMRDYETISTAITAAETGHLVFGTLHTTGSTRTVDRIIDSFPKDQQEQVRTQLALSIVAVISQLLIPKKSGGVVAAFEVMINTSAIENHIRKGETYKITSDIQTGKKRGMLLLDDHLLKLARDGVITTETALEFAQDRVEMRTRIA